MILVMFLLEPVQLPVSQVQTFFSALCSETTYLCLSLTVGKQVSRPHKILNKSNLYVYDRTWEWQTWREETTSRPRYRWKHNIKTVLTGVWWGFGL